MELTKLIFQPGQARSGEDILSEVKCQVELACLGVAQNVQDRQTDTGIKDNYTQSWIEHLIARARTMHQEQPQRSMADIQTELLTWVNQNEANIYNPFLTFDGECSAYTNEETFKLNKYLIGFDPAVDTPVEILHTILLGVVKYVWHGTHTPWTANQKKTYSTRLQATNRVGLSIHAIRANYIMQYANSLIGRQFKTIVQVNVFHVYDLVDETRYILTKAGGELSALLWFTEIRNMEEYLVRSLRCML